MKVQDSDFTKNRFAYKVKTIDITNISIMLSEVAVATLCNSSAQDAKLIQLEFAITFSSVFVKFKSSVLKKPIKFE
jgi:hypothetical protein